ncbi:Oidioi.mRNA.OKI2018_I69.XSR.g13520.t2.cds [Oikopleura dioica]|uniref:Oidioi.mRNA.OKI2018_I69.XSR.g13520.t2.cds n=1 Tax=Oikopleura dioica TaxID=34765 RepID=A0ABN7S8T8_OIKDI|nr:Oidioi.mRNA.OKI2018_I69.XSR.g13520.t2.cds [Oikopleura dioica]
MKEGQPWTGFVITFCLFYCISQCSFFSGHEEENWICLACGDCFCGRFINRHMVDHSMEKYHLVALSLSDLSFWCYVCDEYIIHTNPILHPLYRDAHKGKFGDYPPGTNESDQ